MDIEKLYNLLSANKNCIKINKNLLNIFSLEEAAFYSYFVEKCYICYKHEDYKYFNNEIYFYSPVDESEKMLNLTPFKQRSIINKFQKKNLLKVKFGQGRTRYISLNSNAYKIQELLLDEDKLKKLDNAFAKFIKQINNLEQENENSIDTKYLMDYLIQRRSHALTNSYNKIDCKEEITCKKR